jgi:hypothetical protein
MVPAGRGMESIGRNPFAMQTEPRTGRQAAPVPKAGAARRLAAASPPSQHPFSLLKVLIPSIVAGLKTVRGCNELYETVRTKTWLGEFHLIHPSFHPGILPTRVELHYLLARSMRSLLRLGEQKGYSYRIQSTLFKLRKL